VKSRWRWFKITHGRSTARAKRALLKAAAIGLPIAAALQIGTADTAAGVAASSFRRHLADRASATFDEAAYQWGQQQQPADQSPSHTTAAPDPANPTPPWPESTTRTDTPNPTPEKPFATSLQELANAAQPDQARAPHPTPPQDWTQQATRTASAAVNVVLQGQGWPAARPILIEAASRTAAAVLIERGTALLAQLGR
jgi:hypothetical protein